MGQKCISKIHELEFETENRPKIAKIKLSKNNRQKIIIVDRITPQRQKINKGPRSDIAWYYSCEIFGSYVMDKKGA